MQYILADLTTIERISNNYVLDLSKSLAEKDNSIIVPFVRHTEYREKTNYYAFDSSSTFKRKLKITGLSYLQQKFKSLNTNLYLFPNTLEESLEALIKYFGVNNHYLYIGCLREIKSEIDMHRSIIDRLKMNFNLTAYLFRSANILYANEEYLSSEVNKDYPFSYFEKILKDSQYLNPLNTYSIESLSFLRDVSIISQGEVKSIDLQGRRQSVNLNEEAHTKLNNFLDDMLSKYKSNRNKLVRTSSELSKYFALGSFSYSEVISVIRARLKRGENIDKENLEAFIRQLNWTIYFKSLMSKYSFQDFNFSPEHTVGKYQTDSSLLRKSLNNTNQDLIGFIKIELESTGYITNRSRMILACYLINQLNFCPILVGEYLQSYFVDYNPPVHWSSILWCTGVLDTQVRGNKPTYINQQTEGRRFNITKQKSMNPDYLRLFVQV